MPKSRPDASDKGGDGSDNSLKKPDAEKLSRSITDESQLKQSKVEKQQPKEKDVVVVDDRTDDKFLALSSVQATLAAHVPAIGNVAKQDPATAATYPQWADWHADKNEQTGDKEAADLMKAQSKKARAAIEKETPKEKEEEQES